MASLTATVAALGASDPADEMPGILLDGLHDTFDIGRSLVLASPVDDLALLASRGIQDGAGSRRDGRRRRARFDDAVRAAARTARSWAGPRLSAPCPMRTTSWSFRSSWPAGTGSACWWSREPDAVTRSGHGRSRSSSSSRRTPRSGLHNAWLLEDNRRKLEEIRRPEGRAAGAEPLVGVERDRSNGGAGRAIAQLRGPTPNANACCRTW